MASSVSRTVNVDIASSSSADDQHDDRQKSTVGHQRVPRERRSLVTSGVVVVVVPLDRHARLGLRARRAPALLEQLVDRQVDHIAAGAVWCRGSPCGWTSSTCLDRFEIQALARDAGRALVLRQQLEEALGLAFRVGDHLRDL